MRPEANMFLDREYDGRVGDRNGVPDYSAEAILDVASSRYI